MIDFHTHPLLIREMWKRYPDLRRVARDVFFIRNRPQPLETFLLELDVSGLEQAVLLPIDATTAKGCQIYSNEQIAEVCQMSDRFIGFASVDPHKESAVDDLEHAVEDLKLGRTQINAEDITPETKVGISLIIGANILLISNFILLGVLQSIKTHA